MENPTHQQTPFCVQIQVVINCWQIYAYHTDTENLGDHDFDLPRSLKIKSDGVIGLQIYGFLLMVN